MSKKMTLLALAVASAAIFALPTAASAQEAHIEGITSFTGTGGAGSLVASGEPTLTFEDIHFNNGVINAGGTTGSVGLDFTGCHTTVFGFTAKCHTSGSPLDNTIGTKGVLHVITINNKPGILLTLEPFELIIAGISNIRYEGNLIGTITSPACGISSNTLTVVFAATGPTQNHLEYTGVKYDLTAQTSGGAKVTASLTSTATLSSAAAAKVNCT